MPPIFTDELHFWANLHQRLLYLMHCAEPLLYLRKGCMSFGESWWNWVSVWDGGVGFFMLPVIVFHQAGCFLRPPCWLMLLQWHPYIERWHLHKNCLTVIGGNSQTNGELSRCVLWIRHSEEGRKKPPRVISPGADLMLWGVILPEEGIR